MSNYKKDCENFTFKILKIYAIILLKLWKRCCDRMNSIIKSETVNRKIVYSEALGNYKLIYIAFENEVLIEGEKIKTYGVEIESRVSGREREVINNFSSNIDIVAEFMELIIRNAVLPSSLYDVAIDFLSSDL